VAIVEKGRTLVPDPGTGSKRQNACTEGGLPAQRQTCPFADLVPGTRARPVRTESVRDQGQAWRDDPLAADLVDDIDAVVLPIRPGDAEEEREPPPEAEPPLLGKPRLEDELVPQAPKITTLLLRDAVEKDLKVRPDTSRKLHARSFGHPP
jgi:hypothetical protein